MYVRIEDAVIIAALALLPLITHPGMWMEPVFCVSHVTFLSVRDV